MLRQWCWGLGSWNSLPSACWLTSGTEAGGEGPMCLPQGLGFRDLAVQLGAGHSLLDLLCALQAFLVAMTSAFIYLAHVIRV